jgi:hypothetical protein
MYYTMPFLFDRVKETTTTTGTGNLTLGGAVSGFRTFASVLSSSDTVYYVIEEPSTGAWETGVGTFTSPTTLARTTINSSSNSNNAVNLAAGTKYVFISATWTALQVAQAWVTFTVSGGSVSTTATGKINVSSVTRNGAGDFTINFTTAMPNANYAMIGTANVSTSGSGSEICVVTYHTSVDPTTTACRIQTVRIGSQDAQDPKRCSVAVFATSATP